MPSESDENVSRGIEPAIAELPPGLPAHSVRGELPAPVEAVRGDVGEDHPLEHLVGIDRFRRPEDDAVVLLFTDEFRWRLSSADTLENGSASPVFTPEMKSVLNTAEEIICVGASSEEIAPGVALQAGRALEERRAARRAEQIAVWVRSSLVKPIPTRKLNAGHHLPTFGSAHDTSDQRRVVIILVLDHDKGANIDEALRTAMASESVRAPIFQTLLTQYSLASRPRFTWTQ